jgi:hypothetical protein
MVMEALREERQVALYPVVAFRFSPIGPDVAMVMTLHGDVVPYRAVQTQLRDHFGEDIEFRFFRQAV